MFILLSVQLFVDFDYGLRNGVQGYAAKAYELVFKLLHVAKAIDVRLYFYKAATIAERF